MEEQYPQTTAIATTAFHDLNNMYSSDVDSTCSTPYVSAPSSPGRLPVAGGGVGVGPGFFYSAPTSPMHYMLFSPPSMNTTTPPASVSGSSFEFDFSARFANAGTASDGGSMTSADELFCNGKIRPMKLSTHLQRPQVLAPLLDLDETEDEGEKFPRGRDVKWRDRSLRRRTRSMSPLRSSPFGWRESFGEEDQEGTDKIQGSNGETEIKENEAAASSESTTPSASACSSRSSSVSRSSKRWVFLKEFLYRSKSEGRNNNQNSHKFWTSVSFSPVKDKKFPGDPEGGGGDGEKKKAAKQQQQQSGKEPKKAGALAGVGVGGRGKPSNGLGKRRGMAASAHELHYKANREKAEEMRKKTFLPYRQGLLGCLGFSSKSYGAMNGFARSLNPVSSRRFSGEIAEVVVLIEVIEKTGFM